MHTHTLSLSLLFPRVPKASYKEKGTVSLSKAEKKCKTKHNSELFFSFSLTNVAQSLEFYGFSFHKALNFAVFLFHLHHTHTHTPFYSVDTFCVLASGQFTVTRSFSFSCYYSDSSMSSDIR